LVKLQVTADKTIARLITSRFMPLFVDFDEAVSGVIRSSIGSLRRREDDKKKTSPKLICPG
jgi:hypothetical protein